MLKLFMNCRDVERTTNEWKLLVLHALVFNRIHNDFRDLHAAEAAINLMNGNWVDPDIVERAVDHYSSIVKNKAIHVNWSTEFRDSLLQQINELADLRGKIFKRIKEEAILPFATAKAISENLYLVPDSPSHIEYLGIEYRYILYILMLPPNAYLKNRLAEWYDVSNPNPDLNHVAALETLISLQAMLIIKVHRPVMSSITPPLFRQYRINNRSNAIRKLLMIIRAVPKTAEEALSYVAKWEEFRGGLEIIPKKVLKRIH